MSVLANLRKGTDNTSTRIFIGFVVLVFIVWGAGASTSTTPDGNTYALVNGTAIKRSAFREAYAQQARAAGRDLPPEQEAQMQADVLTALIEQEALTQEAERLGVAVSAEEIAREIRKIKAFQEDDGQFSEKAYQKYLKGMQTTHTQFEERIRRSLLLTKVTDLAVRAVTVTDTDLRAAYAAQETKLDLSFVGLPKTAFLEGIVVSDADRDAFVQQNGDKIKASYDASFDRFYNLPKRLQLRTILLRGDLPGTEPEALKARAQAVRAAAAQGGDFAELAKRWSEDVTASSGGALGLQAADQLDPAIVAAAEAAGAGKITEVVETSRGLQVLSVEKIEAAKVIPLEEVQNDIALSLIREERAPAEVAAFAGKVIAAWQASGAPPRELLEPLGLEVSTTGPFSMEDPRIPLLGDVKELRGLLPTATVGQVLPTPFTAMGSTVVVGLTSRTEPDMSRFEGMRAMLRAQMLLRRQQEYLELWRADVMSRAEVEQLVTTGS